MVEIVKKVMLMIGMRWMKKSWEEKEEEDYVNLGKSMRR